jgi:hypothetical protein
MLRTQRIVGRINRGVLMDAWLTAMNRPAFIRWSFGHYFRVAPPDVVRPPAGGAPAPAPAPAPA